MTARRQGSAARRALVVVVCAYLASTLSACSAAAPTPPAVATSSTTAAVVPTTTAPATASASSATATAVPPFIARVQWVRGSGGRSLHIIPTASGRAAGAGDDDEAWAEVVRLAPDADQPGMRAQFDCHWTFARLVQPDKPSWNIEPWRPVVSERQMVDARCNPGGPESAEN